MILIVVLYALFGSVFTVSKTGLLYTMPLFFVGSRMLIAGLLLLGWQGWVKGESIWPKKGTLWRIFALGLFNIYLTNMFEFWALQYLTSFKTCFIYSLSPFASAVISYFLFSERLSNLKIIGLIIGFAGFVPILMHQSEIELEIGRFLFLSWAEVSILLAALCSVYGWIVLKQLVSEDGYSPLFANGLSKVIGGTFALGHSCLVETWEPFPVTEWIPFLGCTLFLIVISSFICYNLYGFLLRKFTATFLSFAGFITPLFAALYGALFLGEQVDMSFFISAAVVLIGLSLFYHQEIRSGVRVTASA